MSELENQVEQTVESTESAPQVEAQPQPQVEAAPQQAPVVDEWKPNYKVKSYDKEYEIPEDFRSYINKDNEPKFREVFEKYYGLDGMKEKYHKTRENYEKVNKEYGTISKSLDELSYYLNNNDYDSFFNKIKIPEKALQEWMYKKLSLSELPKDQQELYSKNSEYTKRLWETEQKLKEYEEKLHGFESMTTQQVVSQRAQELDMTLSKPEISAVAKAFDERLGQDGAFKQEVISRAAFMAQSKGVDLTVEQAVAEVLKLVGAVPQAQPQQGVKVIPAQPKPTLPNVSGGATSPVTQKVTTIEDLKALRKQAWSQN
jgi:vacuolar-type H+-ATPase subunit I/STV1